MSDTDKSELERIVGNIITACYDVNQTKPGVIKVVDKSMADLQALITQQCNQARMDENVATAVALTAIIPDTFTYNKFLEYAEFRKKTLEAKETE